jgi:membrane fusion protein (multidrug efflux system)
MKKLSSLTIRWIIFIVIIALLWGAYALFNYFYVYTSDAYVNGNVISISPEISGKVTNIYIHEGITVKKGQKLLRIDPTPYQLKLDQDLAALQTAKNTHAQLVASIQAAKTSKNAAKLTAKHAYETWKHMSGKARTAFSLQAIKTARYNLDNAVAMYLKSEHDLTILRKELGPINKPFPAIIQAKADILTDQFNLSKTIIRAPAAGIITNDYLLPGSIATPTQSLFALVEPYHFWVIARYKESALQHIKIGYPVSVYLKMYAGKKFTGTVSDIGYGVNRRQASNTVVNSSLPYLEQTENWIQLQQRFPVRIALANPPKGMPYRVGASARVFIHRP